MVKISVIMPIYNAAEFLKESIEDILAQTLKEFELICVDDGSVDESKNIIEEFVKHDSRVKYLFQKNAGAGAARNTGMHSAFGKYLLFLDADDRFERDMLEQIWRKAEENQADVVIFSADCFQYASGVKRDATWLLDKKYLSDNYIENGLIKEDKKPEILYKLTTSTVWNKLFKADFVREKQIEFQEIYVVDSMYFVMLAMAYAKKIAVYDNVLVHYRENVPTGQLMNHDKSPTGVYEALIAVKENFQKNNCFEEIKVSFLNYAAKMCLERMSRFATGNASKELYDILHNGGWEQLGFDFESESKEQIGQWNACYEIYQKDYIEHLFQKQNVLKQMVNRNGAIYCFPKTVLDGSKRIAVYGAGNVGKSYFCHLMNSQEHQLVGWYDKKYSSYGYPIENPERLAECQIDAVLIAVQMATVADEIKSTLMDLGIDEEKIVWVEPRML